DRRRAVIAVLHVACPQHIAVSLVYRIQRSAASGAANVNDSVNRCWRRGERVLSRQLDAPTRGSSRRVEGLHQPVEVYNEDFAGIISGIGKPVCACDSLRPNLLTCTFVERNERL